MITKVPVTAAKGVNLLADPAAIGDDEVTYAKNIVFKKPGILGLRPALSFIRELLQTTGRPGIDFDAPLTSTPIEFEFATSLGSDREVVYVYLDVNGAVRLTVLPDADPAATVPVLGELASRPCLFSYRDTVYCFTGNDSGWVVTPDGAGSYVIAPFQFDELVDEAGAAVSPNPNLLVRPRFAVAAFDRMWFANLGPGYENLFTVSDNSDPQGITIDILNASNGFNFAIEDTAASVITAIAAVATDNSGSPGQQAIMIWTRKNAYQILGQPAQSREISEAALTADQLATGDMQVNKLNIDAGCVSHGTVTSTPYGTFWAGEDDVWFMPTGSLPQRVGTKIRPVLKDSPPTLMWKWHAVYEEGWYKLAIFAPGQGPQSSSPCNHQWWLDLRFGAPQSAEDAIWFGPQEFVPTSAITGNAISGTYCMKTDTRPGYDKKAYAIMGYFVVVNGTRFRYGTSLCGFDPAVYRDTCAPQMEPRQWQPSVAYAVNDIVVPVGYKQILQGNNLGVHFIVQTAGTSGSTQPNWALGDAATTISDGSVVWGVVGFNISNGMQPTYEAKSLQQGNEIVPEMVTKDQWAGQGKDVLNSGAEIDYWNSLPVRIRSTLMPDIETNDRTLVNQQHNEMDVEDVEEMAFVRFFQSRGLPANVNQRSIGGSAQLRWKSVPGVYVDELNDTLTFQLGNGDDLLQAVIPHGWYETAYALWVVLIQAINNASAPTAGLFETYWDSFGTGCAGIHNTVADPHNAQTWGLFVTQNDDWGGTNGDAANLSQAQLTINRRLAALFGFDTDVTRGCVTEAGGTSVVYATNTVCQTQHGDLQLASIRQRLDSFAREPV